MNKKSMKQCSTSLTFKEVQIKTTMRHHYTCTGMAESKKNDNTQ